MSGEHLARRKDIYIARHPETKQHVAGANAANSAMGNASVNNTPAFTADTAAKLGVSESAIQKSVRRAEKICGKALLMALMAST